LNEKLKKLEKDRVTARPLITLQKDVMRKLETDVEQKSRKVVELENKIKQIEKVNEKNTNEVTTKYEREINDSKKKHKVTIEDKTKKEKEKKDQLESMEEEERHRIAYEAELGIWKQDCERLKREIQEQKYQNEIDLAQM